MQGLTQPTLLKKIFAEDGDKNILPVDNEDLTDPLVDNSQPQRADLKHGFPPITSGNPDDGALPPERKDFNALGNLTTSYDFFYQAGGTFTFDSDIADAIGGYPENARLWYTNDAGVSMILRSTKDDNKDNFVTTPAYIGTSWIIETFVGIENSTIGLLDFKFTDKTINNMSWVLSDGSWLSNSTYTNAYTHLCDDIGFIVINDSGTVKIQVSCSGYAAGDYVRSSADDMTISGTTYYAWKYSTDILYVTLDTSGMSADDAVDALQGQRIYKYENSDMTLTIHKIAVETTDSYDINGSTVSLNVLIGSDGHRIVLVSNGGTEYEDVSTVFNGVGVAWYYVLDKTNTRFKLPRTKYGINGYRGKVGGYIEAGLPDHYHYYAQAASDSGFGYAGVGNFGSYALTTQPVRYHDANSIYGNSNTVQPPATECYLYFYMGGFNDTAIAQTAGITADTINAKMDNDLSNITANGRKSVIGYLIPDYSNGTTETFPYTATEKCLAYVTAYVNNGYAKMTVNSHEVFSFGGSYNCQDSMLIPLDKDDVIETTGGTCTITIYPFKGA